METPNKNAAGGNRTAFVSKQLKYILPFGQNQQIVDAARFRANNTNLTALA